MTDFGKKLREPFQRYLKEQQELLDDSWVQMDAHRDVIYGWRLQKKRLLERILNPMRKWSEGLKRMAMPLPNRKRYFKEKKRLLRVKYPAIFSWGGFGKKFRLGYLSFLNIIRILFILSFFLGSLFLIVYLLMKAFSMVKI